MIAYKKVYNEGNSLMACGELHVILSTMKAGKIENIWQPIRCSNFKTALSLYDPQNQLQTWTPHCTMWRRKCWIFTSVANLWSGPKILCIICPVYCILFVGTASNRLWEAEWTQRHIRWIWCRILLPWDHKKGGRISCKWWHNLFFGETLMQYIVKSTSGIAQLKLLFCGEFWDPSEYFPGTSELLLWNYQ